MCMRAERMGATFKDKEKEYTKRQKTDKQIVEKIHLFRSRVVL